MSVFLGCFAMFAVVTKAGKATFPPVLSAIVSGFHLLRGGGCASTFAEMQIGTHALWNDLWLVEKCPSWTLFFKVWIQSQGEMQKSGVLSDQTWITICWKVVVEFLPSDTKHKTACGSFKSVWSLIHPSTCMHILVRKCKTHHQPILPLLPLADSIHNWIPTVDQWCTNILAAGLFMWSLSVASWLQWHIFLNDPCLCLLLYLLFVFLPCCVCVCICVYPVLYTVFLPSAKD